MAKIKIQFAGGAGTPTGSNFILKVGKRTIMVDCGLFQGEKVADDINREPFLFNPKDIDVLFVTHGHLDHVGRIPKLVKEGFEGVIVSTSGTKDIGEYVLRDSLGILTKEAEREGYPPIYSEEDVDKTMSFWETKNLHEDMYIDSGDSEIRKIKITFYDAGHILGSSMVVFEIKGQKIMFTGDLGNSPSPLLRDTEHVQGINYLIMESVYGDREHEHLNDRVEILKSLIKKTIAKKSVLMIPAFSVERTQQLVYIFNNMVENKEIPLIPIFLDSPLAINITKVYKKHEKEFNENVREIIQSGDDIFAFAGLTMTKTPEDSKAINDVPGPKIIIAGAGMSNGGRIVHHEAKYLPDHRNTLLLIGYQANGTMGRRIQDGAKEVTIFKEKIPIRAEIVNLSGFSAHKDSSDLQDFVGKMRGSLKKVFVVLGEPKSESYLAQRLVEQYGVKAKVPIYNETVEITL
ncbi:Ribonuclease [bioreactor metagenome]|uniref:Ribonuclease n=1 Tax=bioreactor metagenome TaxID=1076179 RepID=A0A644UA17_9ZZZZ|nr:MBL fold metallo-hydrolase [Candidatus Elulimicrobiales bacterium]